jgi:hypothetical protein
MAPDDNDDSGGEDRKVKDLLDPATEADLARWFSLPSVTQLEDEGKQAAPAGDAEMAEVVARRKKAIEAVDPRLLDEILARTDDRPNPIVFKKTIDVLIDEDFGFFDERMVDRAMTIAEPREVEIPDALIEDLKECTPQALLRDLHRVESFFDKTFEIIDAAAEQRLDIVAEVKAAMRASWKLTGIGPGTRTDLDESRALLAGVRADRRRTWTDYLPLLPNRTVHE